MRGGASKAMKEPEHGSGGAVQPSRSAVEAWDAAAPVLVAIDLTDNSEGALVWAIENARNIGAPVEVLHVVHDPADAPGRYRSNGGDPLEPMTDAARRMLDGYLGDVMSRHPDLADGDEPTALCCPGLPAETIIRVAESRGARLVVVGCRGRNGAARLLFGSTSQQVAQKSKVPVTVVKASVR